MAESIAAGVLNDEIVRIPEETVKAV